MKLSENLADRFDWWWQKEDFNNLSEKYRTRLPWQAPRRSSLERIAYNYELTRRGDIQGYLPPFFDLTMMESLFVTILWGNEREFPSRDAADPQRAQEQDWTPIGSPLQWNLKLSDVVLQEAFLSYISHHREQQGVQVSHWNTGKQNRHVPWKYVELLDIAKQRVRTPTENERKSLSNARKSMRQNVKHFLAALKVNRDCESAQLLRESALWPGILIP